MLRRLRYALIGEGLPTGPQKQRSSHLTKTLGTLKDALVPYGRISLRRPAVQGHGLTGRRDLRDCEEDRRSRCVTDRRGGGLFLQKKKNGTTWTGSCGAASKTLRDGDPNKSLEERLGGTEDVQRCKDAVAAAEKAGEPAHAGSSVEPTDPVEERAAAVAADARGRWVRTWH